jgi:aromatic-L-amino-acid decarboxylase
VRLEANALGWLRDWMGFPPETRACSPRRLDGHLQRHRHRRERHLGADIRRGVLYASDQAHHSVLKSAKLAGVMPDRVRPIASDDRYRMRIDRLTEAVAADRHAGLTPFAVAERRNDEHRGSDPLDAIADVCAREGCGITSTATAFFYLSEVCGCSPRPAARRFMTLDPHKGCSAVRHRRAAGPRRRGATGGARSDRRPLRYRIRISTIQAAWSRLSRDFPGLQILAVGELFGAAAFRDAGQRASPWTRGGGRRTPGS